MLEILPSLLLLALAFCGWGRLVLKSIGFQDAPLARFGWSGLAGLSVAAILGSALSFWLPLKVVAFPFAFAGILLFGAGLYLGRERCFPWRSLFALFLFCAVLAAREQIHGDSGLYHFQAVQWIAEEPAVAGLANLHGRFGFNSTWWVIAAMMQLPWLASGQHAFFPVSILGVFFGAILMDAVLSMWKRGPSAEQAVIVCSFYLWFRQLAGGNNPSVATDPPANLLGVATAACMVRAFARRDLTAASLAVILATLAAATKLSAAVWLPGTIAGLIWIVFTSKSPCVEWRKPITAVALSGILGALWIIRGVYCSGFPFYPSQCFGFSNLPWAVPHLSVAKDFIDVQNWPTRGGSSLNGMEFFSRWIENQYGFTNIVFAGCILIFGAGAVALMLRIARKLGWSSLYRKISPLFLPLTTAGAGLLYCFSIAPAMRFASGYFFGGIGILLAMVTAVCGGFSRPWRIAVLIFLATSAMGLNVVGICQRNVNWLGIPSLPIPQVEERKTDDGVAIQVSTPDGLAWNARRPATPYLHKEIIFEFRKDGTTRMVRMPQ